MAGEAQVVETLWVLEGAGLAQCRHQPAVVVLRGHAGPQLRQQQSLCFGGARGEGSSSDTFLRPCLSSQHWLMG